MILVTGANGFIGSHLIRELLARGRSVRAMIQPGTDESNLADLPVVRCSGDLGDEESLRHAVDGCTSVFHLASYNKLWTPRRGIPHEVNVEGTKRLLRVMQSAGVKKIVYTGTATVFRAENGRPAVEEDLLHHAQQSLYERSKFLADAEVLALSRSGIFAVSVCPTAPLGKGDLNLTSPGQLIVDFMRRKIPAYIDTGFNIVDVTQVAKALANALEQGKSGERYIVGGVNLTLVEFFALLARVTGIPAPRFHMPYGMALTAAFLSESFSRWVTHKQPMAQWEAVRLARYPCFYDCQKARRELSLGETNIEQVLKISVDWFREQGFC